MGGAEKAADLGLTELVGGSTEHLPFGHARERIYDRRVRSDRSHGLRLISRRDHLSTLNRLQSERRLTVLPSSKPPYSKVPRETTYRLRRLGLWASAEPAAVLAALLERGFRRTLEAADAALLLVTSVFFLRAIAMASFQMRG